MKKSKKIAIILAISATFGGVLSSPPERTYAADIFINSQDKFDGLSDEWVTESHFYNKNSYNNNNIIIENVETDKGIRGAYEESDVSGNRVIIKNSTINNQVYGGWSAGLTNNPSTGKHTASGNTVIIDGGSINGTIIGGYSVRGDVIGNTVILKGDAKIYADSSNATGGVKTVYGGFSYCPEADKANADNLGTTYDSTAKGGAARDNTIILMDSVDVSNVVLHGGFSSKNNKDKSNNTLTINGWTGSVQAVRSCDNVNFYNTKLSTDPVMTILGDDKWNDKFENTVGDELQQGEYPAGAINIGLSFAGGQQIKVGDKITLVHMQHKDVLIDKENIKPVSKIVYAGVSQIANGEFEITDNDIKYTIKSVGLNDQVNVVNEGRAASAAFLNQSDELISEALAGLNLEDKYGFETFAMVYGNDSRYGTNSDLSINGWSGIVGVGSNNKTKAGDFAWAAFFENGAGNYDISTTMNGITMEGDGSTVYNGGGIAARLTGENGVYGEASLRAGLLKNDLENGLLGADNNKYGYESESNYYGMHIGIGKIFKLENGASVDTYAKYYHSTVKDDSFTIDSDRFEMDDINSDRLRLGIRYNQGMDRSFNVYYGAAWEYEFNGESNGYAQGHKMEETSLKGSTVIGELGVVIQPENSPWSFDAKVKGYGGQRDGYSGSILATYHF